MLLIEVIQTLRAATAENPFPTSGFFTENRLATAAAIPLGESKGSRNDHGRDEHPRHLPTHGLDGDAGPRVA